MHQEIELNINFRSLVVCSPANTIPTGNWKSSHVRQGFIWESNGVTFATMDTDYTLVKLTIELLPSLPMKDSFIRVIKVPFTVKDNIVTITSDYVSLFPFSILSGNYALYYIIEALLESPLQPWKYYLIFLPASGIVMPEILRADPDISPSDILIMGI